MRNKLITAAITWLTCVTFLPAQQSKVFTAASPDKQVVFYLRVNEQAAAIDYRITYKQQELITWSPLELVLEGNTLPGKDLGVSKTGKPVAVTETLSWPFGENATIANHYNEQTIAFTQANGTRFSIVFRVFDNNVAFHYLLPDQKSVTKIIKENTGFNFNHSYTVYRHNTESVISPTPLAELKENSDFPLVLASPGLFMSINEAGNDNYTKAVIGKADHANSLAVKFIKDTVIVRGNFHTPWRTISISETAIGLCNNSDLLYKLSDAPVHPVDKSWIRPGKLLRDMTLTTKGAKDCIDFAQKMNFQYIMFDAGWYGKGYAAQYDLSSDPVRVVPEINMQEVIAYGKEKNIGLILYVNYVGLRKYNMDSTFSLYKKWGVKGLKFGFVDGLTQDGITWLMSAIKKAQDYGFVIDVHDNYKPTGLSRTFPALLTQEGVRGNENNPDAFHNTTLPFTRFLSGAADYTFCYRNQNDSFNTALLSKKLQVSKAQQLALTVIFYSPIQSMLWYGKPADYKIPEEIEFFSYVPTVWDKTIHLQGEIGRYITVARKKAGIWFIGSAANEAYTTTVKLGFLDKQKKYTAVIYEDDGKGGIMKTKKSVTSDSSLTIAIAPKGGQVVMIKN